MLTWLHYIPSRFEFWSYIPGRSCPNRRAISLAATGVEELLC